MQKYLLIIAGLFLFATFADAQTSANNAADEAAIRGNVGQDGERLERQKRRTICRAVCRRRGLRRH